MLTFLAIASALAADCAEPATAAQLVDTITAAEAAFAEMDGAGFERARARGEAQVGCLAEPITPPDAAAWHRVEALAAFMAQDDAAAISAFRSSLAIQPAFAIPTRIAPDGHPLRALYDRARAMPPSATEPMPAPPETLLYVDGARAAERPTERPIVLQAMGPTGGILGSDALGSGEALPDWARGAPSVAAVRDTAPDRPAREPRPPREGGDHRGRTALLAASGGSLVVSGALYGVAWGDHARFMDPSTNTSELDEWRRRTNTTTAASAAMGGVAVGLFGAALVLPW
jgi:hypothetical protein